MVKASVALGFGCMDTRAFACLTSASNKARPAAKVPPLRTDLFPQDVLGPE